MSGLGDSQGGMTFLGTFQGNFTIKATKEEVENSPRGCVRINKNGKETCELHYGTFEGTLCKIATKQDDQYGLQFVYDFIANNQLYQLKFRAKSKQAQAINFRLPNLKLDEEFKLHVFPEEKEYKGKPQISTVLWITQGLDAEGKEKKIERFWTKDVPKELPQAEQKEWEGEMKWDFGKQRKYIIQYIADNIIPKLISVNPATISAAQAQSTQPPVEEVAPNEEAQAPTPTLEEETDDLPF